MNVTPIFSFVVGEFRTNPTNLQKPTQTLDFHEDHGRCLHLRESILAKVHEPKEELCGPTLRK